MADIYFHTWLSRDKTLTFDTQVTYANQTCIRFSYLYPIHGKDRQIRHVYGLVTGIRYTVKIDKSDMCTV